MKLEDSLSPILFILFAEVIARALNSLFNKKDLKGFGKPKWSDKINHLAYANDTILFVSADKISLQLVMGTLEEYEQ